jgi:hypothetical protein
VSFIENIFKSAPFVVEEPPLPPRLEDFIAWAIKYKLALPPDTPPVVLDIARRKLTAIHTEWMLRAAMVTALSEPAAPVKAQRPARAQAQKTKVDFSKIKHNPEKPFVVWRRGAGIKRFAKFHDAAKVCMRSADDFYNDWFERLTAPRADK